MIISDKRANNYLKSLLLYASNFKDIIESIIIFGSHARGTANIHSDVDVLIVLKSRNKKDLRDITSTLRFLETEFNYYVKPKNLIELFLNYLNIATGMFRSWFICTTEDLLNQDFSKITSTNKILVKTFVPAKLILFNIKKDGKVIYGDTNFLELFPTSLKPQNQLIRSFFLNEIIALGGLFLAPFTQLSQKYSLESIKWSLFQFKNSNLKQKNLSSRLRKYLNLYNETKISEDFNPFICIIAPLLVLKLYVNVFNHNKII